METSGTKDRLREVAETFGDVLGTATSRLSDGTEVAWAVHVNETRRDLDAGSDGDANDDAPDAVVTVLGANASSGIVLMLRLAASPLTAMEIVRSLCHRGEHFAAGDVAWLEPGDARLSPLLTRPSAYLLLSPRELGIEDAAPELLFAAGLEWSEVLEPLDMQKAAAIARGGIPPRRPGALTGSDLRTAATNMVGILRGSTDQTAMNAAAHGLAHLVQRGAGPALVLPLVGVLRDPRAAVQARESACHLLDEAGAIEPVLQLVAVTETRQIAFEVFRLRVVDALADIEEPPQQASALGLPDGFLLDSDDAMAVVDQAIERHPLEWLGWLVELLPPLDARTASMTSVRDFLSTCREELRRMLRSS